MPLPQRRWLHHTPPSWARNPTYFITICCRDRGSNQLCTPEISEQLSITVRRYQELQRWHVSLWLLMPDHVHALLSVQHDSDLKGLIADWKRFTAREANICWHKGFFDHRLRGHENLEKKADYIRMNPVRQGLVACPEDWPHVFPKRGNACEIRRVLAGA